MFKKTRRVCAFLLAAVLLFGMCDFKAMAAKETMGENVILNPEFADSDISAWTAGQGGATIRAVEGDEIIYGTVKTYGEISNRTSPYDCIAQDITALVENGKEYKFCFYAKLSEDYEGAPAEQRELNFAPYVTIDGQTSYLGSYSTELTGTCSKQLTPGAWTQYTGTFKIDYKGNIDQIVIRLLEQGTNYGQGECVLGDYYITGVSLREIQKEPFVLQDVTPLKDAVIAATQEDFIVGGAVTIGELNDEGVEALVRKHFNALTIGNELKPDAIFNYSNQKCPGTTTAILNGEEMVVPVVNFDRAENILDRVLEWNKEDPDNQIKMRGHTLVWHAQTPEWFFHEDYDASKPYVSKEEMDKRLEWYIKTVLEHFTAPGSKYEGLFYGWDVVNEAVSDGVNHYRSDAENPNESLSEPTHGSNSSWWHVYQSEEYIINAFRYANKYAPADVQLFYNDYNECGTSKRDKIVKLINAIKATEDARIDGMGMQGHYGTSSPDTMAFLDAMRAYGEAAGSVMITEWDLSASDRYDGTAATRQDEYIRQAKKYLALYCGIQNLRADGINVTGFTFWGTIDKYSWLQSRSNVGGGTDGTKKQCPLLFDDNYEVKPAYWAFVDRDLIETNGVAPEPEATPEPTKEPEAVTEATPEVTPEAQPTEPVEDTASDVEEAPAAKGSVIAYVGLGVGSVAIIGLLIFMWMNREKKEEQETKED